MKDSYSIYEAKAKLSELIRRVKHNRLITITERNVPVAMVIPIKKSSNKKIEQILKELEEQGIIESREANISNIKTILKKKNVLKRFLESRE